MPAPLGHINTASKIGAWPFGEVLLDTLIASVDADRVPITTNTALEFSDHHEAIGNRRKHAWTAPA